MQLFILFLVGATLCTGKRANGLWGLRGLKHLRPPPELLKELEDKIGKEHREAAEKKLWEYEKDLQGTFNALPKNERGAIEAPSVRYTLHRLFSQRYGFQVKGLENSGGAWDAASPIRAMDHYVLPQVRELFEERLGAFGLDLHELAVLAATMDNMFHKDVAKNIDIVLRARGWDRNVVSVGRTGLRKVLIDYIASIVMHTKKETVESLTAAELVRNKQRFERSFPRRKEAMQLLRDITTESGAHRFDYDLIVSVITDFNRRLAGVEEDDCMVMKKRLVKLEQHPGNGRVRLVDFSGDGPDVQFNEDESFLREHGVLDESNPNDVTVIIPNYLHAPSNCVSPSQYYNICCLDECEALMDHIEVEVAAPVVSPERIASVVTSLEVGRDYNRSGGDLSPILKRLLRDIADHHGGQVPIHGRLFAQWMHQAFPRECAHPTEAWDEMTNPATSDSHILEDARDYQEQLQNIITNNTSQTDHTPIGCWSWREQLVDPRSLKKYISKSFHLANITDNILELASCAAAVVLGRLVLGLMRRPSMKSTQCKDLEMI